MCLCLYGWMCSCITYTVVFFKQYVLVKVLVFLTLYVSINVRLCCNISVVSQSGFYNMNMMNMIFCVFVKL